MKFNSNNNKYNKYKHNNNKLIKKNNKFINKFFYNKINKKNKYEVYNLHVKKTLNNYFLTLTKTVECNVIYQLSAGNCKINTKKKKKSSETLRQITIKMVDFLIFNKITYIKNFFIYLNNPYYFRKTFKILKKNRVFLENLFIFKLKTHNGIRKAKPKRL